MNKENFILESSKIGLNITEKELAVFDKYALILQEYNQKFNLTSIIETNDIYLKHFYDSLCLFKIGELKQAKNILDIGTGAGFPGVVIAIMIPNAKITLVESNEKKCTFLRKVCEDLNLKNVLIVNERAEEFVKKHIEEFDIVTSRAVANLIVLSEIEVPALKINGYFLPLKSHIDEELAISKVKIKDLGCEVVDIITYTLPIENSRRTILKIRKVSSSNKIYPREYNKIIKDLKKMQK